MKSSELFAKVTNDLVALMEQGTNPWRRPWLSDGSEGPTFGLHRNAVSKRAYRGLNVLLVNMAAYANGYTSPLWMTPRQAMAAGLSIKGQKCTQITFWSKTTYKTKDDSGEDTTKDGMFCRVYHILNLDQCEGDKTKLHGRIDEVAPAPMERHVLATSLESGLGLTIGHGGDRAFYAPGFDRIQMPAFDAFESEDSYCATLTHEAIHSTGAKHRLDRQFGARFGDSAYAFEELVAELGAAFVGAVTGHSNLLEHHASYLDSWVSVLKGDNKAILTAASKAQAAADMVLAALAVETVDDEERAA